MPTFTPQPDLPDSEPLPRKVLQPRHVAMIEEALLGLGSFGEVRLIVEKGRLRFLVIQKSIDIHKWRPGDTVTKEIT